MRGILIDQVLREHFIINDNIAQYISCLHIVGVDAIDVVLEPKFDSY